MRDAALHAIAALVLRRPRTVVIVAALLALAGALYARANLRLNADTNDLIAPDRPYMKQFTRFMDEFGDTEHLFAVVDAQGDPDTARRAVAALDARLRALPDLPGVFAAITPQEQRRIATRAMTDAELADFARAADAYPALVGGAGAAAIIEDASRRLGALVSRAAAMDPRERDRLGAAAVFALTAVAGAALPDSASARAVAPLSEDALAPRFITSDTGRMHFITIVPNKNYATLGVIDGPLALIRQAIDATRAEFPGVPIGLTGKPVLQADEMSTTNTDMMRASAIAIVGCAGVIIFVLGGFWRPMLAVLSLAIASAWTYGAATLLVGQLNLLSIVFMLVLIGVGMDYGVHVISRFRELRASRGLHDAIHAAVVHAGRGNLTGAATSAGVFLMALFTSFQGLRELGVIAGVGLLLCMGAMTLVLPALLVLVDPLLPTAALPPGYEETPRRRAIDRFLQRRAGWVLAAAALASAGLFLAPGAMRFEKNLLKLQAEGLESVAWERRVQQDSAANTWFGVAVADRPEDVPALIERARREPIIGAVRSALDIVRPDTPERTALRASLPDPPRPPSRRSPLTTLESPGVERVASQVALLAAGAAAAGEQAHADRLAALHADLGALAARLTSEPDKARALAESNLAEFGASLDQMLRGDRLSLRDALPDAVREQFVAPSGRLAVLMHPREDVWDYDKMGEFVAAMRRVDPEVTGVPITHYESIGEMGAAFVRMSLLALALIVTVLLLDFRSIRDAAVCLLPLAVGMAWTIEALALLGVSFNLANFFAAPILLGLSVDSGVHILHRFKEGAGSRTHLGATRRAVVVTSLTTMIGFGALVIAHHKGLRSLGIAMGVGTGACLIAAIIVLPAAVALLERNGRARPGRAD